MTESLKLENQLCFRLYSLNKAINRLYAPLLAELGLTYPQYLVMLVLWQQSTAISVNELGEFLDLDSGTLSPLLKRMENQALLKRVRSSADERKVMLELTTQGKALQQCAQTIPQQLFQLCGLNENQYQSLCKELDALLGSIKE